MAPIDGGFGFGLGFGFDILWFAEDFSVRGGIGVARPERLDAVVCTVLCDVAVVFCGEGFGSDDVAGQSCCYGSHQRRQRGVGRRDIQQDCRRVDASRFERAQGHEGAVVPWQPRALIDLIGAKCCGRIWRKFTRLFGDAVVFIYWQVSCKHVRH